MLAGVLFPELVSCMVLLQVKCPLVMQRCGAVPVLGVLIDELDKFNKVAPGMTSEDADDLAWPGLTGKMLVWGICCEMKENNKSRNQLFCKTLLI